MGQPVGVDRRRRERVRRGDVCLPTTEGTHEAEVEGAGIVVQDFMAGDRGGGEGVDGVMELRQVAAQELWRLLGEGGQVGC